jgi:hypothetical protein
MQQHQKGQDMQERYLWQQGKQDMEGVQSEHGVNGVSGVCSQGSVDGEI